MARDYGRIRAQFWTDDKVRSWSMSLKAFATYLLTCEHATALGCFRLSPAYIADDLEIAPSEARAYLADLEAAGFIHFDQKTSWVWIRNYLTHNKPENGNVLKHVWALAHAIPDGVPFKQQVIESIDRAINQRGTVREAETASETPKKNGLETDEEPSRKGSGGVAKGKSPGPQVPNLSEPNRTEPNQTDPLSRSDTQTHPRATPPGTPPPSARASLMAKAWQAIGVPDAMALPPNLAGTLAPTLEGLIAEGCDWAADIAPALAKRPGDAWPSSPSYWATIARGNRAQRLTAGPSAATRPAHDKRPASRAEAEGRAEAWLRGTWFADQWGPPPGEPGCTLPAKIADAVLAKAKAREAA